MMIDFKLELEKITDFILGKLEKRNLDIEIIGLINQNFSSDKELDKAIRVRNCLEFFIDNLSEKALEKLGLKKE